MPRIQISEPGKKPQPYKVKIDREDIKIGRAGGNDILVSDPSTSSNHCIIRRVEGGFIIEDNNSTNGIKLDDQRFQRIDLNQDLDFEIGDVEVSITFSEEEYDILSEEDDFESEQKPMLPPSGDEKKQKQKERAKAKRKALEKANDDITSDDDDDEEEEEEAPKRSSSSRASRMVKTSDEDEDDAPPPRKSTSSAAPRRAERLASSNKTSAGTTLAFVVLCILGFLVGLCLKHKQVHGTFNLLSGETTEVSK